MCVCHSCDEPSCVNPAHFFLGTNLDNHRDKMRKGRQRGAVGTANVHNKLTESQVRDIISRKEHGAVTKDLSAEFGVSCVMINRIARGDAWKHLPKSE